MSESNTNAITETVLKAVFNTIKIKMPGFLTNDIEKSIKNILIKMSDSKNNYDTDIVHLEITSNVIKFKGVWDFVFSYNSDGNIVIDGFVTGIHSIHKKCKFKTLAVAKITEPDIEKHFVGKYIKKVYDEGKITISEYEKLMWKFSLLSKSIRNRIDSSDYSTDSNRLILMITSSIKIKLTSKGFSSSSVVIYNPVKIELKVAQKYLSQLDVILKHHW